MKNGFSRFVLATVVSLCLAGPAWAQGEVYQTGSSSYGGQTVNSYTNAGAAEYRKSIRVSRGGGIYNVVPFNPPTRSSRKYKVPNVYSYKASANKDLPSREIWVVEKETVDGRLFRRRKSIDLSDIIEAEAKRNNVDPLLVEILIRHESNYRPDAVSRTGAQGLMQLMPGTATMLGVSDAYDPASNVAGGTRYLAQQLATFKDLRFALAAYNAGPGAVKMHGGVPPYAETQNYVNSIVSEYARRQKLEDTKSKDDDE